MKTIIATSVLAVAAGSLMAADVNPDVIMGSGITNGAFTVGTGSGSFSGVELGLRARVRFDENNQPQNQSNYDGTDTYRMVGGNPTDPSFPTWKQEMTRWNFDFSVNTDVDGSTGNKLTDFTYTLSLFKLNANGTNPADAVTFDPINTLYADHSIGDNSTTAATDSVAADATAYDSLITSNNVAQNSWNYSFFDGDAGTALENWDASAQGSYIIRLTASDMYGMEVASTDITVNVVPLPTAAFAGLGLLGVLGGARVIRRR